MHELRTKSKYVLARWIRRVIILFIFLFAGETGRANDNYAIAEYWQEFYVYRSFSDKFEGQIMYNNLYSNSVGNYDWFVEGKMQYNVLSWLNMEMMYRHEFYDYEGSKVQEYRPMLRVSGKTRLGSWNFRNRHRVEYRMFETGGDHIRYRNDVKINPEWDLTPLNINPYFTEEIFIAKGTMTRNRLYAGLEAKKGRFEPALYFLLQSDTKERGWMSRKIVGVMLGIELQ